MSISFRFTKRITPAQAGYKESGPPRPGPGIAAVKKLPNAGPLDIISIARAR